MIYRTTISAEPFFDCSIFAYSRNTMYESKMNRERSLLSMRYLFPGCSLKPRPKSRAFAAVWYSGLSYNHRFYQQTDARTRKSTLKREKTIDLPRSSSFGNFKRLTRFWRSLSSIELLLEWWYKGGVTRDDSQRWVLAQHSFATLLQHWFECLQYCSSITTKGCIKSHRCGLSRVTSP